MGMNIKKFDELSENNFADLKLFFDDLLKTFQVEAKDTRGILLDVVGGFGFKQETVVVDSTVVANEVGKSEEIINGYIDTVYGKHKTKIRKRILRDGSISFTYR